MKDLICYCFDYTVADIELDLRRSGQGHGSNIAFFRSRQWRGQYMITPTPMRRVHVVLQNHYISGSPARYARARISNGWRTG